LVILLKSGFWLMSNPKEFWVTLIEPTYAPVLISRAFEQPPKTFAVMVIMKPVIAGLYNTALRR